MRHALKSCMCIVAVSYPQRFVVIRCMCMFARPPHIPQFMVQFCGRVCADNWSIELPVGAVQLCWLRAANWPRGNRKVSFLKKHQRHIYIYIYIYVCVCMCVCVCVRACVCVRVCRERHYQTSCSLRFEYVRRGELSITSRLATSMSAKLHPLALGHFKHDAMTLLQLHHIPVVSRMRRLCACCC